MKDIQETIRSINDKAALVAFVESLANDCRLNGEKWENDSLERFLAALARWLSDSDGYYANIGEPAPKQPSWKNIAEMLAAARAYE